MKTGVLSKRLGVTSQTIRRWCERYGEFLSDEPKLLLTPQANYTDADFLVLATIRYLSSQDISLDEIETRLRAGYRIDPELFKSFYDGEATSIADQTQKIIEGYKQSNVEIQKLIFERDYILDKNRTLEQQVENLTREIAELKYQLGMTTGELNSLRRQMEQDR